MSRTNIICDPEKKSQSQPQSQSQSQPQFLQDGEENFVFKINDEINKVNSLNDTDKIPDDILNEKEGNNDDIIQAMRSDMVTIIKLLQTLNSKIGDTTSELDNIKEDIYVLASNVDNMKNDMNQINKKYQQFDDTLSNSILPRLDNKNDDFPITTHTDHTEYIKHANSKYTKTNFQTKTQQNSQKINNAMRNLQQKSQKKTKSIVSQSRDHVGNNTISPQSYNIISRGAKRCGNYENKIKNKEINEEKLSSRGIVCRPKNTVSRKDVVLLKNNNDNDAHNINKKNNDNKSEHSEETYETNDSNGKNIQIFRS